MLKDVDFEKAEQGLQLLEESGATHFTVVGIGGNRFLCSTHMGEDGTDTPMLIQAVFDLLVGTLSQSSLPMKKLADYLLEQLALVIERKYGAEAVNLDWSDEDDGELN